MLDRNSMTTEYNAWRNGTDMGQGQLNFLGPDEVDKLPPHEQTIFYRSLRRQVLGFALMARMAIDDRKEECEDVLAGLQYAMLGLRGWYYARPKVH